MNKLLEFWPKQISFPERILCKNRNEFFKIFRSYDGIKNKIYMSLYNCDFNNSFENAYINVIGFDIDTNNKDKVIENVLKLHNYENYLHLITFSTKGFWFFLFTRNYENVINKKECLINCHNFISEKCNLVWTTYETQSIGDLDHHIRGDLARVVRIPLSYDVERKLYCIPVTIEDLEKGYDYIKEKAKNPCYNFVYYGEKLFDVSKFDYIRREKIENINIPDFNYNFKDTDKLIKDFIPCIKYHLLKAKEGKSGCNWRFRWLFVVYCRTISLPRGVTDYIAKKYFSNVINKGSLDGRGTNYDHFVKTRMLDYGYSRTHKFPNCETLFSEGICKGKCDKYNKLYK